MGYLVLPNRTSANPPEYVSEIINYQLPQGSTPRAAFTRSFACYVFDAVSGTHRPDCSAAGSGSFDASKSPSPMTESLRNLTHNGLREIELDTIRSWWNTWSYITLNLHDDLSIIPDNLTEFIEQNDFKSWPKLVVKKSHVKNKTRVIYRSNELPRQLSVSETLDSTNGDLNAPVLETEVVRERSDTSGHYDFFVYDIHGKLTNRAQFPSGERPAPSTCMSCHFSRKSGKFERVGR